MCCFCFCFVVFVDVSLLVCFVVVLLFTTEARPAALPLFSCLMALVVSSRVGSSSSSGLIDCCGMCWIAVSWTVLDNIRIHNVCMKYYILAHEHNAVR